MPYTIGLDFGTNSVRCLIVDTGNGNELGTAVYEYETGEAGIIIDPSDHNLARQNPADYIKVQQKVKVRVIAVDLDRNRISLSMKNKPGAPIGPRPRKPTRRKKSTAAKKPRNQKQNTPFHNPSKEALGNKRR